MAKAIRWSSETRAMSVAVSLLWAQLDTATSCPSLRLSPRSALAGREKKPLPMVVPSWCDCCDEAITELAHGLLRERRTDRSQTLFDFGPVTPVWRRIRERFGKIFAGASQIVLSLTQHAAILVSDRILGVRGKCRGIVLEGALHIS